MKPRIIYPSRLSFPLAAAIAALLAQPALLAGTGWDGGGADTNINTANNWNDNLVNALDGSTTATFGTGGSTATINTNASFSGITINRDGNFTIADGAGSLTLGAGGIAVSLPNANSNRSHTISESSLILGDDQIWSIFNNSGASATLTVSSVISETGGTRFLEKSGTGNLILSGANTYTGGTMITGGALVFRNLVSKASTGTHAFDAGTTLGLGVGGTGFFSSTDVDNAFAGTMTGNLSNVTVDATTNIGIDTTAGNFSYASNIGSVTRGLTKFGGNTLTLSSATNAYTGVTTVEGGTLAFGTLANAGTNSSIGNFPTAGATGLVLRGGTLNYTGASVTTNRGFTTSGPGGNTIQVGVGVNLVLGDSIRNDTVSSGSSGLNFAATGAGSSITIPKLSSGSSISSLDFSFSGTAVTATINNLEIFGPRTVVRRGGSGILNIGTVTGSISGSNSNNTWFGSTNITGTISGLTGEVFFQDTNTVSGSSSFTARVRVRGGAGSVLTINSIKNWAASGAASSSLGAPNSDASGLIDLGHNNEPATLRYVGSGDSTNRRIDLTGGGTQTLEQAGSGLLHYTGNIVSSNAGPKTLRITGSTAGTGQISGIISNRDTTNTTSLEKTGTGTWTLSGANTYSGTTAVNGGTLVIGTTGSTHASSAVTVSNSGSALVVNGTVNGTLNANVSTTVSGSGTVVGAATVAGNLNPGNSPGELNFTSTLTLANSTVTTMEINGAILGTGYDNIDVGSTLTFDGTLTLALGTTFGTSTLFDLFEFGTQAGSFDSVSLTGSYTGSLTNNGFGVWTTTTNSGNETWSFSQATGDLSLTVIPEPSTALLGVLGMLALLRRRR